MMGMKNTWLFHVLLAGILLISISFTCFAETSQNKCDIEVGSNYDTSQQPAGKELSKINADAAIASCKVAIRQFPNEARVHFQLGLAYRAAKQYNDAVIWLEKASSEGYRAAKANLGVMYQDGLGVSKDGSKAMSLYNDALISENKSNILDFVSIFDLGWGVNQYQDYKEFNPSIENVSLAYSKNNDDNLINYRSRDEEKKDYIITVQAHMIADCASEDTRNTMDKLMKEHPQNSLITYIVSNSPQAKSIMRQSFDRNSKYNCNNSPNCRDYYNGFAEIAEKVISLSEQTEYILNDIRVTDVNEKIGQVTCKANLSLNVPDYGGAQKPVTYTSTYTSDKKPYVELYGQP
jgi:TPR repeat protein